MRLPVPRSLAAQMATLIALALLVAQAVGFTLAARDRRAFRLAQATRPAAIRIADALEREAQGGRPILADRGRVRREAADPLPADAPRRPEVAAELSRQLAELNVGTGRVDAGLITRSPPRRLAHDPRPRDIVMLQVAVEQPGRGWLTVAAPWPRAGARLVGVLLLQTLLLYVLILLPVLWIVRRLSRPLQTLTRAAASYDPHAPDVPLPAAGPADLHKLIDAFNALRLRVTGMLDEKDRMLGAIGHDLRTPLAALRVRIESVEDDTDRERMADTIEQMSRTLDDILSLARVGRPSETPTEVDLAALVDAVVEDFRDLEQDVTFVGADRLPLRLRPTLMRRAVRNLIENAVKYGGSALVKVERTPGQASVIVDDDGPGIPAEELTAVFEPFNRLERSRNSETGGIGLGLALAHSIVREAGGKILLANRPEGGLRALIVLPR